MLNDISCKLLFGFLTIHDEFLSLHFIFTCLSTCQIPFTPWEVAKKKQQIMDEGRGVKLKANMILNQIRKMYY